jgi:hypothetical protein
LLLFFVCCFYHQNCPFTYAFGLVLIQLVAVAAYKR